MRIYLGADHRGFKLKTELFAWLEKRGYDVIDCGAKSYEAQDDFPKYAQAACLQLIGDDIAEDSRAILLCGGGQGMAMAANRFEGVRAAVVHSVDEIWLARKDSDANVLALPADELEKNPARWQAIVETFLTAEFSGLERYKRRNKMLDKLEGA